MATTNSSPTEHFYFCMGFQLSERDDDGFPQLMVDQSRNVDISEAFYRMFYETQGAYIGPYSDIDTLIPTEFSSDRLLFFPARLSGYTGKTPSSDYVSTYTSMASATETSLSKVIAEYQKNQ